MKMSKYPGVSSPTAAAAGTTGATNQGFRIPFFLKICRGLFFLSATDEIRTGLRQMDLRILVEMDCGTGRSNGHCFSLH